MHPESDALARSFASRYVTAGMSVADVGSFDVNGTFRGLFPGCRYVGLDIAPGPNVDRVVEPYDFGAETFDAVISGSTMEHVEDLVRWGAACIAITKPGGVLCIIAPHGTSGFTEHRHPVDCWRIFPDGMRFIFRDLDILECRMDARDTVLIARRPLIPALDEDDVRRALAKAALTAGQFAQEIRDRTKPEI